MLVKIISSFFYLCLLAFLVSSCTYLDRPDSVSKKVEGRTLVPLYASESYIHVVDKSSNNTLTCTMSNQSSNYSLADADSIFDIGKGNDNASAFFTENEMSGRTPTNELINNIFYRSCEFAMNYNLSKDEALKLFTQNLKLANNLGTIQANATTISVGDNNTVSDSGSESLSDSLSEQSTNSSQDSDSNSNSNTDTDTDTDSTTEVKGEKDGSDSSLKDDSDSTY
jgi:hypothetical protein